MPIGYLQELYDRNISVQDFVLVFARHFLPDVATGGATEDLQPSTMYSEQLQQAQQRLAEVGQWDDAKAEEEAERAYQERYALIQDAIEKTMAVQQRYMAMLGEIRRWTPPRSAPPELKPFIIDVLLKGIRIDANVESLATMRVERESGIQYKGRLVTELSEEIAYCEQRHNAAVEETRRANQWLRELRESLAS